MFEIVEDRVLKEAADRRARSRDVLDQLSGWFEGRREIAVLDVAPGIGETLRATAPLLPPDQTWTLLAADAKAEAALRDHLTRWAPDARAEGSTLMLARDGLRLAVRLVVHDASRGATLPAAGEIQLITAGSDLGHFTDGALRLVARAAEEKRAAVYAGTIYDGRLRFTPHNAADGAMTAAFHRALMRDRGSGPAAGPLAGATLGEQLTLAGHSVIEGKSTVVLRGSEAPLIRRLQSRLGEAQRALAPGHDKIVDGWLARARTAVEVSQTDLIALPP